MLMGLSILFIAWFTPIPVWVSIILTVLAITHIGIVLRIWFWIHDD